jgi:hypothetical protein
MSPDQHSESNSRANTRRMDTGRRTKPRAALARVSPGFAPKAKPVSPFETPVPSTCLPEQGPEGETPMTALSPRGLKGPERSGHKPELHQ